MLGFLAQESTIKDYLGQGSCACRAGAAPQRVVGQLLMLRMRTRATSAVWLLRCQSYLDKQIYQPCPQTSLHMYIQQLCMVEPAHYAAAAYEAKSMVAESTATLRDCKRS